MTMQKLVWQLAWFIAVGCAAAATHWLVVVAVVSAGALAPLAANVVGWLVAFCVSFAGHYQLTFKHHRAPLARAARRFFAVSALGFGRSEEHTSELQSLMRSFYAVFCLKKKKHK